MSENQQFLIPMTDDEWAAADSQFFEPEAGSYTFRVANAAIRAIEKTGKSVLTITPEISRGPYAGKKVANQDFFLTKDAAWRIKGFCDAVGVHPRRTEHGLLWNSAEFVGKEFVTEVKYEKATVNKQQEDGSMARSERDFLRFKNRFTAAPPAAAGNAAALPPGMPSGAPAPGAYPAAPVPQQGYAPQPGMPPQQGYAQLPQQPMGAMPPAAYPQAQPAASGQAFGPPQGAPPQGYAPQPAMPPQQPQGYPPAPQQGYAQPPQPQQPQQGYAPAPPPNGAPPGPPVMSPPGGDPNAGRRPMPTG